jgi:hypothetical protein
MVLSRIFRAVMVFSGVACFSSLIAMGQSPAPAVLPIQFLDSVSGRVLRPAQLQLSASSGAELLALNPVITASGQNTLVLGPGVFRFTASVPGYEPAAGLIDTTLATGFRIRVLLDPVETPTAVDPDAIARLLRDDIMLIQGFVVAEDTHAPLAGARVRCGPGILEAFTDADGFFRLFLQVSPGPDAQNDDATLEISCPGFRTERRLNVETWARGDCTYRLELPPGEGVRIVDERTLRHRAEAVPASDLGRQKTATGAVVYPPLDSPPVLLATAPTNSTVRVPRQIRVLRSDNVTIDYVSMNYYTRCVLPSEWIPSWGSYIGGSNSLNAGAIAARCYAIAKLNGVSATSAYDICATTSCQVYNPANINSGTDRAVNFTDNWVVINSAGTIPSTEYSAENNQFGSTCGDGFTAPTGGCMYDPVCSGESTFGHGRGMCQWGTARWATGRRMAGRSSGDATPNGYSRRDWMWIVRHYYPALTLVKGQPLLLGDDVQARRSLEVRACPDGSITNGLSCGLVAAKASGARGVIIGGPTLVTNDSSKSGFTWYRIQWSDGVIGWSVENYLERLFSAPTLPPASLVATPVATNQINLSWSDATEAEAGFTIERSISSSGPWLRLASTGINATSYSDKTLYPGTMWFYRVQAFNSAGAGPASAVVSASTPGIPPLLPSVGDRSVMAGTAIHVQLSALAIPFLHPIAGFESYLSETANGVVLFRAPRFSGSTSGNLNAYPDLTAVTDAFPSAGHATGLVLRVSCDFTNASNSWLRLTTASTANLPNPVMNLAETLRFDIYSDRPIQVGLGIREATIAPGTPLGSDGGAAGGIEWVGITNKSGSSPIPVRAVPAGVWTSLSFFLPQEPVMNFSGGDGVLSTPSGLGVLEHLAIVPSATGVHHIYLDNFTLTTPKVLTYTFQGNPPAGALLAHDTGKFSWTPGHDYADTTNVIAIRVTDNSIPPLSATQTFAINVLPLPVLQAPELSNGSVRFVWNAFPGFRYWVQYKDRLDAPDWNILTEVVPVNGQASFSEPASGNERYYRVSPVPTGSTPPP